MPSTMIQFFHWYYTEEGILWKHFESQCSHLSGLGFDKVWLPPATKGASGTRSVGYDPYDLFDLGEFDQKGTVRTKYGTKEDYLNAIAEAHQFNIEVLFDTIVNHKAGADFSEKIEVIKVKEGNRNIKQGKPQQIKGLTGFSFQGRGSKYSSFAWDKTCFKAVDWDSEKNERAIFLFTEPFGSWEEVVGSEKGNYDYLMFADIDFRNSAVCQELKKWAEWLFREIEVDGFRVDAAKHVSPSFLTAWIQHLDEKSGRKAFAVAEFWSGDFNLLKKFLKKTESRFHVFDVPLHYNLFKASLEKAKYDLRWILKGTVVSKLPHLAVTFVDNHDTQPFQALESWVAPWFRPLAYALILLRKDGIPCVFYPDLYGASYQELNKQKQKVEVTLSKVEILETLLICRERYALGKQIDYFDSPNCIGWIRSTSVKTGQSPLVVIMSNNVEATKIMNVGKSYAGKRFGDILKNVKRSVMVDQNGYGTFVCSPCQVSVYLLEDPL